MTRDLIEAIKEEIDLIEQIEAWLVEEDKKGNSTLGDKMYKGRLAENRQMLNRIVQRVETNIDYTLGINEGKVRIIAE
jgi:hypothetical protein